MLSKNFYITQKWGKSLLLPFLINLLHGGKLDCAVFYPKDVIYETPSVLFHTYLVVVGRILAQSVSNVLVSFTTRYAGEGPSLPPWDGDSTSSLAVGALVGILLIAIVLVLVVVDILCCKFKQRGESTAPPLEKWHVWRERK